MSITKKAITILVGVVVIVGIGYFISGKNASAPTTDGLSDASMSTSSSMTGDAMEDGESDATKTISGSNTSVKTTQKTNASIDADMAAIDTQLNAVATDEANADKSLNDTPIQQSY